MGLMDTFFGLRSSVVDRDGDALPYKPTAFLNGERAEPSFELDGRYEQSLFGEATAYNSKIPQYRNPSPLERLPDQRRLRSIIDHLHRTEPRIGVPIQKKTTIAVGTKIRPKSKFNDAVAEFQRWAKVADARGEGDLTSLVAQAHNVLTRHGGFIARRRSRLEDWAMYPELRSTVPLQVQLLTYDWLADDHDGRIHVPTGATFVNGVAIRNDRKMAYALYNEHPTDAMRYGRTAEIRELPAREVYHCYKSSIGVPRGECPLTSMIGTADNLANLMAFADQRRIQAVSSAVFFKQATGTLDAAPTIGEGDKKQSTAAKWIRRLQMRPGIAALMPPGVEMQNVQPPADATDHDKNVKTANMVICAVLGVPYHEAMGDWKEAPERAMRYAGADLKREILQDRRLVEQLFLNPLWRDFIDMGIVSGRLRFPAGTDMSEVYEVEWSWPPVQSASLDRELNLMLAMVVGGVLPPSRFVEEYFGLDFEVMCREWAHDAAVAEVNGMKHFKPNWEAMTEIAKSILAQATEEEAHERASVEAARQDKADPSAD